MVCAAIRACSSTPPSQQVAHQQEHGAHQRLESLLGVHVPGRLGLQPGEFNLMKYVSPAGVFDIAAYRNLDFGGDHRDGDPGGYSGLSHRGHCAQLADDYRPLGLGYANLGGAADGVRLPYDSERGETWQLP